MIEPSRRQFLFGMLASTAALAIPEKFFAKEKKLIESPKLTPAQATVIETKLQKAIENPQKFIQENCQHLKGGQKYLARRPKPYIQDFAISDHIFPDGHRRVACTLCFKKWFPGTPEWREAEYMLIRTTNTQSRSEVVLQNPGYAPPSRFYTVYQDKI